MTISGSKVSGSVTLQDSDSNETTYTVDADVYKLTFVNPPDPSVPFMFVTVGAKPQVMFDLGEGDTVKIDGTALPVAQNKTWTMPAKDTTMEIVRASTDDEITVTFMVYDDVFHTETISAGSTVSNPAPDPEDPNGTKTFRYWTTDEGTQFDFSTELTENMTLTAKFAICVTFDLDGGTGTLPDPVWEEGYSPLGIDVQMPTAEGFTKDDQVLTGWSDGTTTYKPGTSQKFNKSTKLTAVWGSVATPQEYSITYDHGYGTGYSGNAPTSPSSATSGSQITLPTCTWTRTGYTFAGWKVQHWIEDFANYPEDGGYWESITDTVYQPNATYPMPDEKICLLATWTKATVTLKFDSNGGSGTMSELTFAYGDTFYSKINNLQVSFTPPQGQVFAGWAYTATGGTLSNTGSSDYTVAKYGEYVKYENDTYTLTLYAKWVINTSPLDVASYAGVWTSSDDDTVVISTTTNEYYAGCIIYKGEFIFIDATLTSMYGSNSRGTNVTITPTEGGIQIDGTTYTNKKTLNNVGFSSFEGAWQQSGASVIITVAGDAVTLSISTASDVTAYNIDKYLVITYRAISNDYQFVLSKEGDQLVGFFTAPEGEPVARTFDASDVHYCTSQCPICEKCTNEDCSDPACSDKCQGHPDVILFTGNTEFDYQKNGTTYKIIFKSLEMDDLTNPQSIKIGYSVNGSSYKVECVKGVATMSQGYLRNSTTTPDWMNQIVNAFQFTPCSPTPFTTTAYWTFGVAKDGQSLLIGVKAQVYATLTRVGGTTTTHVCQHVCDECGKCTDSACEDPVCNDKCAGHEVASDEVLFVGEITDGNFITGTYIVTSIRVKDSTDATTAYITYTYNGTDYSQSVDLTRKGFISYGRYGFTFNLPGEGSKKIADCEIIFLDNGNLEVTLSSSTEEFVKQN